MRQLRWAGVLAAGLTLCGPSRADADDLARARAVLARAPMIDGHIDVPEKLRELRQNKLAGFDYAALRGADGAAFNTDLARLKAGGYGGVFWSVFVPADLAPDEAVRETIEQIDVMKRVIDANPDRMALVGTAAQARAAMREGKVAGFLGAEGGHSINNSLAVLRQLYALGVRYMTLTHFKNNGWADSATDAPAHGGLAPFGREVVREMNRVGMLVDLSHVAQSTMLAAIETSAAPVIFSHSGARAVGHHPRNVPDAVLTRLAANGGVVMVDFAEPYVSDAVWAWGAAKAAEEARLKSAMIGRSAADATTALETWETAHPAPHATIPQIADHIDHIRKIAGIDHIGIGSDYDGVPSLPTGLEDVSKVPALFAELLRRGYSDADCAKIADGNILRVLEQAEQVSTRLRHARGPSEAVFATK